MQPNRQLISPPRADTAKKSDTFSQKAWSEEVNAAWKDNINTLQRLGAGLRIQWNLVLESAGDEITVCTLLRKLLDSLDSFEATMSGLEQTRQRYRYTVLELGYYEAACKLVGEKLIPNLFTFIIAPLPSAKSQALAATIAIRIVNTFSARLSADGMPVEEVSLKLLGSDDWDNIAEEHSLREAIEVALADSGGIPKANNPTGDNKVNLEVLCPLLQLLLMIVNVSESAATSILCESKTGLDELVSIGHTLLQLHRDMDHEDTDSEKAISCVTALCYVMSIMAVICQIPDAAHLLAVSEAHGMLAEVIQIPSRLLPQASPAVAAGTGTAHGLALQLLATLSESCFEIVGPFIVNSSNGVDVHRSIVTNLISGSPFAEVIESATLWLVTFLKLMTKNYQLTTKVGPDHSVNDDRTAFMITFEDIAEVFTGLLDRHRLLYVLQEVVQRHLTTSDLELSGGSPTVTASSRCCVAALMCLQTFIVCSPWQLGIPRIIASKHKTTLGLLLTIARKNRFDFSVHAPVKYLSCKYVLLTIGAICSLCPLGREVVASLLISASVMGSGRGASGPIHTAQTISNMWSDAEAIISFEAENTSLSDWCLVDEFGTELACSDYSQISNGALHKVNSMSLKELTLLYKSDSVANHLSTHSTLIEQGINSKTVRTLSSDRCGDVSILFWIQEETADNRERALEMTKPKSESGRGKSQEVERELHVATILYAALHKTLSMAGDLLAAAKGPHPSTIGPKPAEATAPLTPRLVVLDQSSQHQNNKSVIEAGPSPAETFNASMTLITSLAHHYVGNVLKLRKLETAVAQRQSTSPSEKQGEEANASKLKQTLLYNQADQLKINGHQRGYGKGVKVAREDILPKTKILFSSQAQSTRCWSVRDVQPDDVFSINIPVVFGSFGPFSPPPSSSSSSPTRPTAQVLQPNFQSYNLAQMVYGIQEALRGLHQHLCHLQSELDRCPISRPSRRCFLNDLYSNVYPKCIMFLEGIANALGAHPKPISISGRTPKSFSSDAVGRALYLFIGGEKQSMRLDAGNLLDAYHFVLQGM